MHELSKDNLHLADPLLSGSIFYPEAAGVVLGHNVGCVYVDHPSKPTCALVWVLGQEGFYCLGNWANAEFVDEIGRGPGGELGDRVLSCGFEWFDISGDSPGWDATLRGAFASHGIRDVQTESQYVYRYGLRRWREVRRRSEIRPIDAALLSSDVGNRDVLEHKLLERWMSLEDFLRIGAGYCAVVDGRIASVCFSGWAAGSVHAVTIETVPELRGRGLARSTAAALMEEYDRRGILPHWDVMPSNKASIAVAESLGLAKAYEYNVHFFKLQRRSSLPF